MAYMLGASCAKCCGDPPPPPPEGWYCCPEANCMMDSITSIYVTITPASSQYIRNFRSTAPLCGGYHQHTVIVPCDSVSGTHKLKQISDTEWGATLPVDALGCLSPTISLQLGTKISSSSGTWELFIKHPSYYWYQSTTIGNAPFKSLSQMSCIQSPPWTGSSDCSRYIQNFQQYNAQLVNVFALSSSFTCIAESMSFSSQLNYIPAPSYEKGPLSQYDVSSIDGSLSCEIKIEIL